jgi:hypothetical protein
VRAVAAAYRDMYHMFAKFQVAWMHCPAAESLAAARSGAAAIASAVSSAGVDGPARDAFVWGGMPQDKDKFDKFLPKPDGSLVRIADSMSLVPFHPSSASLCFHLPSPAARVSFTSCIIFTQSDLLTRLHCDTCQRQSMRCFDSASGGNSSCRPCRYTYMSPARASITTQASCGMRVASRSGRWLASVA